MSNYRMTLKAIAIWVFGFVGCGLFFSQPALAQTRLSPEPIIWNQPENEIPSSPTNPSIYYMIAGPAGDVALDGNPTRWRLALSCAEVYCGITFDYIEIQQEFEGLPRIVASYRLNGADLAPLIGVESDFLHDIRFVAWESWDRVLMQEGDRYFRIHMNPDYSFDVESEEKM